ncbi:antigenic cell wall protein [Rutstroemia sp. NJR-2017a WRK4]|nr:antigenic cell wall protein [Rutstroemia sp. NJR-2017a WRK4]
MRFYHIIPLCFFVTAAIADGAAILNAIDEVANTTTALNTTVSNWDGSILSSFPIITLSTKLLIDINSGTHTAQASANLSLTETITIAGATSSLVTTVQSTLQTIIKAKPKFDHLLFSPLILLNLVEEKSATDKFSAAIIQKVPVDYQALAEQIVAPVHTAFGQAILVYEGLA